MRQPGSYTKDDKGKIKTNADTRKLPASDAQDVAAKRAAQAPKPEVTHAVSEK